MKHRMMIKKIIAIILTVVILVTGIPTSPVFASSKEDEDTFWYEVVDAVEETIEAIKDSYSHNSAGNWYLVRNYDRLPWNFFHNRV